MRVNEHYNKMALTSRKTSNNNGQSNKH